MKREAALRSGTPVISRSVRPNQTGIW